MDRLDASVRNRLLGRVRQRGERRYVTRAAASQWVEAKARIAALTAAARQGSCAPAPRPAVGSASRSAISPWGQRASPARPSTPATRGSAVSRWIAAARMVAASRSATWERHASKAADQEAREPATLVSRASTNPRAATPTSGGAVKPLAARGQACEGTGPTETRTCDAGLACSESAACESSGASACCLPPAGSITRDLRRPTPHNGSGIGARSVRVRHQCSIRWRPSR